MHHWEEKYNLPGSGADTRRCETSEDMSSDSRWGSKHTVCQNSLAHATSSDELPENSSLSSQVFTSEKIEAISLISPEKNLTAVSKESCYVAIEYLIINKSHEMQHS